MNLRKLKAFTLIELLVVIAIIGILAALIIVSLSGARNKANDTQRKNNTRNLDTALAQYYLDQTPPAYPVNVTAGGQTLVGKAATSTSLDPYLTSTTVYGDLDTLTHKYVSGAAGVSYAIAWQLASASEQAVSSGNGVYAVTGVDFRVTAPNALYLTGYGATTNKAFLTFGPQ